MIIENHFENFSLNEAATQYIPLKRNEITTTRIISRGEMIISPDLEVHYVRDDSCEMNIMLNPSTKLMKNSMKKKGKQYWNIFRN